MRKVISYSILMLLTHLPAKGQDYNNKHRFYLEGGITSGMYKNSYDGGFVGGAGVMFFTGPFQSAVDIRSKEVYIVSPSSQLGALSLSYRLYLKKGFYFGLGAAHHHHVSSDVFIDDPMGSLFGANQNIQHRTGPFTELGYDFRSFIKKGMLGIYPTTNLSFAFMPGYGDPIPMVNLSVGIKFGLKRLLQFSTD